MAIKSVVEKRFLDSIGVRQLWERITQRYDSKLDSIEADDSSVSIKNKNRIKVKISKADDNVLQLKHKQGEEGLYVPSSPKNHKLTFGVAEKQYVYDGSEDVTVPVYTGDVDNEQ